MLQIPNGVIIQERFQKESNLMSWDSSWEISKIKVFKYDMH